MREAGFEYLPHPPIITVSSSLNANSREFRTNYGFGLLPRPLGPEEISAEAQTNQQNPNLDVITQMNESVH